MGWLYTSVMSIHDDKIVESTTSISTKLISVCFTLNNCYYCFTRLCVIPHRGLKIPHSAKVECGFWTTPEECLYGSGAIGPSV